MSLLAKRKGEAADDDGKANEVTKCDPEGQKGEEETITAFSDDASKESVGTQLIVLASSVLFYLVATS
jgi:hypothetical protein